LDAAQNLLGPPRAKATTSLGNIHTLTAEKKSTSTQKVLATVYAKQASAIKAGKAEWKTLKEKQEKADSKRNAEITDDVDPLRPSADSVKVLRHTYANKINAERAARAEWLRLQRGGATLSITAAMAHPELFPELPVVVQGFKPEIDGASWIITRCTHSLSDSGFTTAFEFELKANANT
jgi:phage protein D